jgi:hypothetical protein
MLAGHLRWARSFLSSRWGPLVAMACWGGLAGFASAWLMPPATPRRPMPVAAAEGPLGGSPRVTAAVVPSAAEGPDATIEASGSAAAGAAVRLQPTMISLGRAACGGAGLTASAGCASHTEPSEAHGERPGAAQASTKAPAAVLIRHRGGSAAGREAAQRIADEARRGGVRVVGIRAVPAVPSRREVHFLRGDDAAEGERLASRLRSRWGNDWHVRELEAGATSSKKLAAGPIPAHTLEVWLPHR